MDDRLVALDHTDAKRRVEDSAAIDGLAHALSHDVRAVFRSTQGFAQVVANRSVNALADEDMALLKRIIDASQRGNEMLDQLVMWLRTVQYVPKFRSVDLRFLLEWSASEAAECALDLHIDGALQVSGDEHLLKRLFDVLLSNACNFVEKTGEPAQVHARLFEDAQGAHIQLRDAGIGVDANNAERAFAPFVRLHSAQQGAGQGLGLAMARTIVEKHGGTISLSPAEGGGSVVAIHLPVNTEMP